MRVLVYNGPQMQREMKRCRDTDSQRVRAFVMSEQDLKVILSSVRYYVSRPTGPPGANSEPCNPTTTNAGANLG